MSTEPPPEQRKISEESPSNSTEPPPAQHVTPESAVAAASAIDGQVFLHPTGKPPSWQNPVRPGARIGLGETSFSEGSLGMVVVDHHTGRPMLLTAGYVLGPTAGIPVIQPGLSQGGTLSDQIGEVARTVRTETCDAGVAWLTGERDVVNVLNDGSTITGIAEPTLGMKLYKQGWDGISEGTLNLINATVNISFGTTTRRYSGMFIISPMSQGGDSGAVVLETGTNRVVGLIIGGSAQATICVPISEIIKALDIEVAGVEPEVVYEEQALAALVAANDQAGERAPDRLGYETYIDIFTRLIREPGTQPPLTIGIYGNWGSGKTFLMKRLMERLEETDQPGLQRLWQRKHTDKDNISTVLFNAWEYEASEDLWAGLVEKIFATIESDLPWYRHLSINFRRNLKRETIKLRRKLIPYTFIVGVTLTTLIAGLVALGQERAALLVSLLGISGLIRLGVELVSILRTPQSERIATFFSRPNYRQRLGFMAEIREDLEALAARLPEGFKVVVFVDDLDRCKPEKAVEVLEAIKLMLDFRCFIVFLGIDVRIITRAIEQHYGTALVKAGVTGYEYLHKIVQIPFNIPDPGKDELRVYLNSLMGAPLEEQGVLVREEVVVEATAVGIEGEMNAVEQELTQDIVQPMAEPVDAPKPQPARPIRREVREVFFLAHERAALRTFIPYMVPNPRRIKRLVNIYRVVRDLAKVRRIDIQQRLEKLLSWLLLNEQWPYTACLMLEILDNDREGQYPYLAGLHHEARQLIGTNNGGASNNTDADQDLLADLVRDYAGVLTRQDIVEFSALTINLNPVICSEVIAKYAPTSDDAGETAESEEEPPETSRPVSPRRKRTETAAT